MLTRIDSPASVEPSIQTLLRMLSALGDELSRMPTFKAGTAWEADRRREQGRLVAQLARLGLSCN